VWLDLRTSQDVDYSDPQEQSSIETFRAYNEQLVAAAAASGGYLQVADWATHSDGADGWFEADGVHLTPTGVDALTTFIADAVDQVLAGEQISPAAAPWTLLLPGAEGDAVVAVQEALLAAGLELPGGADGVYGNDTMVAVAAFQRADGALRETGAVDVATAQALGVYDDPAAAAATATPPVTVTATTAAAPRSDAGAPTTEAADGAAGGRTWLLAVGAIGAAVAAGVLARRRYVVARRAARRRARVHPAASPHRSVADMRRAGQLPPAPGRAGTVYDHEQDELVVPPGPA